MTSRAEFKALLQDLLPADNRPIVVYSGLWYIARSLTEPLREIPAMILGVLRELAGPDRTLAMPTHTAGFKDGLIDLDHERSQTGILTELFRKQPGTQRTASAFFSYAVSGPGAAALAALRAQDAWGDDSIFGWMEETDASLLMIGEPWDACSLKHRAEFLLKVPYRYFKTFKGEIIKDGRREALEERLYVRSLEPLVENDWSCVPPLLAEAGMKSVPMGSGQIAHMSAKSLVKAMIGALKRDAFAFCRDRETVRRAFLRR